MRVHLIPAVIAALACGAASADDADAIVAAQEAWEATLNGDDPAAAADHFTADARLLPPDRPMAEGSEAIVAFWTALIEGPGQIDLNMIDVDVIGDTAIETGTYDLTLPVEDGGETVLTGKTLVVWKRGADGTWRMAQDMWNNGT